MNKRILVGIPCHKPERMFLQDCAIFLLETKKKYEVEEKWVYGKTLVDAQNEIGEYFLSKNFDYLLFLEDDHSGHSIEMLDAMIESDKDITAIGYYSRWPAHPLTLMVKSGKPSPKDYRSAPHSSGIQEVDLCGFGFTLIKRKVIESMDKPIFRLNGIDYRNGGRNVATDKNFFERAKSLGCEIHGFFDFDLAHRGISKKNVMRLRENWMGQNSILQRCLKKRAIETRA